MAGVQTNILQHFSAPRRSEDQRGSSSFQPPDHAILHRAEEASSFTFVCLGVGGGPLENDCSCYILKPGHREWSDGAIVIEGGSWLGALTRVMEDVGPSSAFADVQFPHHSPALRAGYLGSFAHSFLISHAHLDHILGMVLGSASLPGKRKVYGLRPTLENLLDVFNGKIWPKLASFDDDGGPAVYHLKALEDRMDTRVDEALVVLPFALSHGLNPSVPPAPPTPTHSIPTAASSMFSKRYSLPLNGYFPNLGLALPLDKPVGSMEKPQFTSPFAPDRTLTEKGNSDEPTANVPAASKPALSIKTTGKGRFASRPSRRPKTAQGSEHLPSTAEVETGSGRASPYQDDQLAPESTGPPRRVSIGHSPPALDSTAFFITNTRTGKDVLFFGDVEPDCISRSPRNKKVWTHAARRFAEGKLNTVFLECSFPASHPTEFLYGHLSVNHLFDELRVLSRLVIAEKKRQRIRRQKITPPVWSATSSSSASYESGPPYQPQASHLPIIPALHSNVSDDELKHSLEGLHVIIVHVKMALFPSYSTRTDTTPPSSSSSDTYHSAEGEGTERASAAGASQTQEAFLEPIIDPRTMQERIEEELVQMEAEARLGVRFVMAKQGMKIEC